MVRRLTALLLAAGLASAACHPGPVISPEGKQAVGGTIAGIVSTDGNAAVPNRKVTAIETSL